VCGIAGIFDYRLGARVDTPKVGRMTELMIHRGPDEGGVRGGQAVALGARRLRIIDPAGGGQPFASDDGAVTAVHNGEIYNFRELRSTLEGHGHRFRTRCDTEVVVHAYEQWGPAFVSRLNGMFALAVWDARTRRLVAARDPFGIKPLYYCDESGLLAFASEIRSLLAAELTPREVDPTLLGTVLALGYLPSPATLLRGVRRLPPGHSLVVTEGDAAPQLERFVPEDAPTEAPGHRGRMVGDLRSELVAAVERQLVADVPVGVLLSGGVDSTLRATLATELRGEPVDTFTIGFAGAGAVSELAASRATASRLGARHHELTFGLDDFRRLLRPTIRSLEEPIANPTAIPFLALCRLARQVVGVALSGQGGDEAFGGYDRYVGERLVQPYRSIPAPLRSILLDAARRLRPRDERIERFRFAGECGDPVERALRTRCVAPPRAIRALLQAEPVSHVLRSDLFDPWQRDGTRLDAVARMLYVDARTSLADNLFLFGDKISMAASLEVRVPLADGALMARVERIPSSVKVGLGGRKRILRQAARAWLPRDVLDRGKVGFETPVDSWLRGPLAGEARATILESAVCADFLDPTSVGALVDEHVAGTRNHKRLLYGLLALAVWHEEIVEARTDRELPPSDVGLGVAAM
jgi:asparagine synthase (glutamine-hydrolysing)